LFGLRLEKTWKQELVQTIAKKTCDLKVAAAATLYAAKPDSWTYRGGVFLSSQECHIASLSAI